MKRIVIFSLLLCACLGFYFYPSKTAPRVKYPHTLAICAMFKNEAPWLKEWIEYHRLLGATHFYLYNNDSTDDFATVLAPYVEKGIVETIPWESTEGHAVHGIEDVSFIPYQLGAYNDCLKNRALGQAEWVAIIDIDEFIVPVDGQKAFLKLLNNAARSNIGTLRLPWRIFGTSHVQELASGELLTEKLCLRAIDKHPWHGHVKSIHRPEAIDFCFVHETDKLKEGFTKKRLKGKNFRIHHYWTRTEKFLLEKRNPPQQDLERFSREFNVLEDRAISPFLPQLKQRLQNGV